MSPFSLKMGTSTLSLQADGMVSVIIMLLNSLQRVTSKHGRDLFRYRHRTDFVISRAVHSLHLLSGRPIYHGGWRGHLICLLKDRSVIHTAAQRLVWPCETIDNMTNSITLVVTGKLTFCLSETCENKPIPSMQSKRVPIQILDGYSV